MNLQELVDRLNAELRAGVPPNTLVAAIDNDTRISTVKSVEPEFHGDADGSWTFWIKIEEN